MTAARLIPPRIALVDPRTGGIAREWYLYFLALTGDVDTIDNNALGFAPVAVPVDVSVVAQDALGLAPQIDTGGIAAAFADQQQYGIEPSTASLAARVAALESIVNDLRLGVPVL
jgi:hypothetical protein